VQQNFMPNLIKCLLNVKEDSAYCLLMAKSASGQFGYVEKLLGRCLLDADSVCVFGSITTIAVFYRIGKAPRFQEASKLKDRAFLLVPPSGSDAFRLVSA
jgi:hypothetical protein